MSKEQEFNLIKDLINNFCGLVFTGSYEKIFKLKVLNRVKKLGKSSVEDYYFFLKNHSEGKKELQILIDELVIKETYFFREIFQFEYIIKKLIPEIKERKKEKIKIWSAGCSTGEEPYTLAILLNENGLYYDNIPILIIGTDISETAIKKAEKGVYSKKSFRKIPSEILKKYFTEISNNSYQLIKEIKNKVEFNCINLLDKSHMEKMINFDIVICRNVLIYFDIETKKRVLDYFYNSISDDGYLFIGQSEILKDIGRFEVKHDGNVIYYRKK